MARSITEETVKLIRNRDEALKLERPQLSLSAQASVDPDLEVDPEVAADFDTENPSIPADSFAVTAPRAGWVQQIDEDGLFHAIPDGSVAHMASALGTYSMPNSPMVWIWPPPDDESCAEQIRAAIALGDERTMQQDVGYGILQLVDIALRALSPGVNDPNTANDVIAHIGVVLLRIWETPEGRRIRTEDGKTLVRRELGHGEFLEASFGPLRRYGASDAGVVATMVQTLMTLRTETERRDLPGPTKPIDEAIAVIHREFLKTDPSPVDREEIAKILDPGAG